MTQQVYNHRVRTITDLMIVRGLELAIEDGNRKVERLFSYDGSEKFLEYYLQFDDARLMALLKEGGDPRSSKLFNRLAERRLFKEVALIHLDEGRVQDSIRRGQLLSLDKAGLRELELQVAHELKCEPWEIIALKKSIRHPAYQERASLELEAIHVLYIGGTPRMMSDFPDLVSPKIPSTQRIHVIAPVQTDDVAFREELEQRVRSLILESAGDAT